VEDEDTRADEDGSRAREHTDDCSPGSEGADQPVCEWQGGQWQSMFSCLFLEIVMHFFNGERRKLKLSKGEEKKLIPCRSASSPSPNSSQRPTSWQCTKPPNIGILVKTMPKSSRRRRNYCREISSGTSLEACRPVRPIFPHLHFLFVNFLDDSGNLYHVVCHVIFYQSSIFIS
jgi:hypothetical protein